MSRTADYIWGEKGLKVGSPGNEQTFDAVEFGNLKRSFLKKATGLLAAVDDAGGVFSWENPEGAVVLIEHIALIVTTKTSAACTVDVGTTAVSATTSSDNLIDGVNLNAATGTFANIESSGTNGKHAQRLPAGKWVTASKASGASAGLVGTYEIYYRVL